MLNFKQTAGLFKIAEKIIYKKKKRNTVEVHLPGLCAHMFGCYESALLDKFLITTLSLAHNRYLFSHGAGGQNPKINVTGPKSKSYQGHTPSRGYSRKTFLASSSFWWLTFLAL